MISGICIPAAYKVHFEPGQIEGISSAIPGEFYEESEDHLY